MCRTHPSPVPHSDPARTSSSDPGQETHTSRARNASTRQPLEEQSIRRGTVYSSHPAPLRAPRRTHDTRPLVPAHRIGPPRPPRRANKLMTLEARSAWRGTRCSQTHRAETLCLPDMTRRRRPKLQHTCRNSHRHGIVRQPLQKRDPPRMERRLCRSTRCPPHTACKHPSRRLRSLTRGHRTCRPPRRQASTMPAGTARTSTRSLARSSQRDRSRTESCRHWDGTPLRMAHTSPDR